MNTQPHSRRLPSAILALLISLALLTPAHAAPPAPSDVAPAARQVVGQAQDDVGAAIQWMQDRLQELGVAMGDQLTRDLTDLLTQLETIQQAVADLPHQTTDGLEALDAALKGRWAQVERDMQADATAVGLPVVAEQMTRLVEEMMVATRGHVTHADGSPAAGVVVVRFLDDSLGEKWLSGFAITDANGDYTLLSPDGLITAFRYATGLAQGQGVAPLPAAQVVPLELLPATPPYQQVAYDPSGSATVTPGDQPLSAWDILMRP